MKSADQHNAEIHENLRHWNQKPALRQQYEKFYNDIAVRLTNRPAGIVLECGSGIGNIKSVIPDAVTSDLFPNPWLDRQENVYSLTYPNDSLAAVVLFDVFHHLQYPGWALQEIRRALRPNGLLIIFEPAMGLFGRVALGLFHHEPLALYKQITWKPCELPAPESLGYYAAQGNAWRIFARTGYEKELGDWQLDTPNYYPALPWLATGGFRGPSLLPASLLPSINSLDRLLSKSAPRFFASRLMISLTKK